MLKALFHSITRATLLALVLTLSASQLVSADVRYYRYDGNMPFVKMMLNMMVAMGILDKVPAYNAYGYYGQPGSQSYGSNNLYLQYLYSRNPYLRALALRGLTPGNNTSPFLRTPWLQSPWASSGYYTPGPLWGSPSWGVQPKAGYPYIPYGSRWSAYDLSGWVDEPWETSVWNDDADEADLATSKNPGAPIVQNFYNVPEEQPKKPTPLNRQAPAERTPGNVEKYADDAERKRSPLRKKLREKPCVTEFCGLKKPDLNGLWVAQDGEMLGVNGNRYLWSDGVSRYLRGEIKIQNEYLLTSVDDYDEVLRFKYKLAGDYLLTLRPDGTMREFIRTPVHHYQDGYRFNNPYPGY